MTPAELHAARERLGLTQAQLADALRLRGRDRTRTVRAWEKGEKPITGPVQVAVELMLRWGSVIDEIAVERRRQIEVEGWTTEHDDGHEFGEIAAAAGCYALNTFVPLELITDEDGHTFPRQWPWGAWWKPKTRRRDLIRAAALIVAEIERLDRAAQSPARDT